MPKTVLWTAADGITQINLSDRRGGYWCQPGRDGFGPVDAQVVSDIMADGSALVRGWRQQPRVMAVPLGVQGDSFTSYLTLLNALYATFTHPKDPATGLPAPGRVTVITPDGNSRSIAAYYQSGASMTEDTLDDVAWNLALLPNLAFYAPVPTWEGAPIAQQWALPPATAGVPPLPPILIGASNVIGESAVLNPGDRDAYPVWTITGPATPVITNNDTGESYAFNTQIPAGTVVTVDCRPQQLAPATGLTVMDQNGTDWWEHLVDYPDFWALPPGTTSIDINVPDATSATTVALASVARWAAGW